MIPSLRVALLTPPTFKPESRVPGLKLLVDRFSTITRAAGQAAQFAVASLRYLSHAGNAQLRGVATGWWRSVWVYTDTKLADQVVMSCSTIADNVGYDLRQLTASGKYQLTVGNGAAEKTALSTATPANAGWHQVYIEYDGTNIGISVDDEAIVQTALAAAYSPGANGFNVGASLTPLLYFDGRMQCLCGGDGVLTTAQRTAMYNGGTPLAYDQIPGAISQTPTFFMFELNEPSGARVDIGWNALSLTSNNSVGTAAGTVLNAVSQWNARVGANFTQATQANKPVIRSKAVGGRPGLRFDGTNDILSAALGSTTPQPFSIVQVYVQRTWVANNRMMDAGGGGGVFTRQRGASPQIDGFAFTADALTRAGAAIDAPGIGVFNYNGASSEHFENGAGPKTGNPGSQALGSTVEISSSTTPSQIDCGAFMVVTRLLTPSEQRQVERYYAREFGVVLA